MRQIFCWLLSGKGFRHPRAKRQFKLCIFKPDRIGDFILATGAIHYLVRRWGEKNCVMIVSQVVKDLALREFPDVELIVLNQVDGGLRQRAFPLYFTSRRRLRHLHFEDCVSLRHARDEADEIILSWVDADQKFIDESAGGLNHHRVIEPAANPNYCAEIYKHQQLLSRYVQAALPVQATVPRLSYSWQNTYNRLVVSPYGSNAIRTYPTHGLATILAAVSGKSSVQISICGSREQKLRLELLKQDAVKSGGRNIDCVTFDSITEFFDYVSQSKAVLTMETAAAHFCAAIDMPAVIIIGGGHYGLYGPWSKSSNQVWMANPLDCFGCNWLCKYDRAKCIGEIPSSQIIHRLLASLQRSGASAHN